MKRANLVGMLTCWKPVSTSQLLEKEAPALVAQAVASPLSGAASLGTWQAQFWDERSCNETLSDIKLLRDSYRLCSGLMCI